MAINGKYDMYATRRSLLSRVKNPDDHESWQVFFDTYNKLVYSVAAKAGLDHSEAEDVVQETFITLARTMPNFKYDPAVGSFKNWLIKTTDFKIKDQFRRRKRRQNVNGPSTRGDGRTAMIERVPDPKSVDVESIFEHEWRDKVFQIAVGKVKEQVPATQFQIFDLYVIKKWPVRKVATTLGIGAARVYMAKHRLTQLVKREVKALEAEAI
jgi:RNA polymerase sigma-70 factor (ECF subfamily)